MVVLDDAENAKFNSRYFDLEAITLNKVAANINSFTVYGIIIGTLIVPGTNGFYSNKGITVYWEIFMFLYYYEFYDFCSVAKLKVHETVAMPHPLCCLL